ncbi:flavin reductase (DIM6/NTAB) family NADH-FMN oxidoreductase RutF [Bradyrhizobium macuxiense]|uniref:Flavin reductase (DIM6/NTAB) family NADH-FMN oxidoreductase RutF n=1 Tax=Bradyrhizobium macuxiense TaxID=1755647 RepID=A0A560KX33_9BRAD|nr:flavin reductase (DIM6/NTAB) family NADH-FMN oxidoreductase RutF [Bradyrhizobium macuxiense]
MLSLPLITDDRELRDLYGSFASGVIAVCAILNGDPVGMTVSAFVPVSLRPPLVSVCIQNASTTWQALRTAPRVGISILAKDHDRVARQLAGKSVDRFQGIQWDATSEDAVLISDATAWVDCSLHSEIEAGDHVIALFRVHSATRHPELSPLIFHGSRFHQLHTTAAVGTT